MSKHKLTDSFIRHHEPPSDKRIEIYDTTRGSEGLAVRITPAGGKSFIYRYRSGDRVRTYTIGKYPAFSLADARERKKELYRMVAMGLDPIEEERTRRQRPPEKTFKDLADDFKSFHLPALRKKTRQEYKRIIDNELIPAFGHIPVKELDRGQVISLLDKKAITNESPTMANRIRARLHSIFEFGISRGIVNINPVSKTKPFKEGEQKRERYYSENEIRKLWKAFDLQDEPARSIFMMLLICGQRSTETRSMRWVQIKNDVWTIPASLSKSKRQHAVPLSPLALQILDQRRETDPDSEYVFESPSVKGQPLGGLKRPIESVREISGVTDFRPHDLRRTAATYMAKLNVNRTILGKVLNHKGIAGDGQVTAIYDRHEYLDEKKAALDRWSANLETILEAKEGAKIHKIS